MRMHYPALSFDSYLADRILNGSELGTECTRWCMEFAISHPSVVHLYSEVLFGIEPVFTSKNDNANIARTASYYL